MKTKAIELTDHNKAAKGRGVLATSKPIPNKPLRQANAEACLSAGSLRNDSKKTRTKILSLLSDSAEDPFDPVTVHIIRCGLHSSFPESCIIFFLKIWHPFVMKSDKRAFSDSITRGVIILRQIK